MESPRIKIGLAGLGHLGKIHLKCLLSIPEFEVIGVYDLDSSLSEKVGKENGLQVCENFQQLVELSGAIDIVTPTTSHFELAAIALNAGKHIFIEKPITTTLSEATDLAKIASNHPFMKIQVGHIERFNPAFVSIRHLIKDPLFVECHRLSEFNPRGTDVSVILDLMIHDLDLLLHIVHSPVKTVHASGVSVLSNTPDICNVRIEFENGCVANLTASRISMKKMRKTRIFQRDAYISMDLFEKSTQLVRMGDQHDQELASFPVYFPIELGDGNTRHIGMQQYQMDQYNAMEEELKGFAHSILYNTTPIVTLQDGINSLELALHILDKIELNNQKIAPNNVFH